jgi:RNase P subunit RPR2
MSEVIERCPHCKQIMPGQPRHVAARICADCKKPIERHHKYRLRTNEHGTFFVHRHCDNPLEYHPKRQQP